MRTAVLRLGWAVFVTPLLGAATQPVPPAFTVGIGGAGNTIAVDRKGDTITLDYQATENGRGPKQHEVITLGSDGLPTQWRVTGTTTFGSPIDEQFARTGDHVVWRSQAETGDQDMPAKRLYIANDGSPYAAAIYADALLKAPGMTLAALPYGKLTLVKLRDATVTVAGRKRHITRYRIDGIDVTPTYVVLDDGGALIATGGIVRTGFAEAIKALGDGSDNDEMIAAQAKLAHRFDGPVQVRNVHVFDPAKGVLSESVSVTSFRGRISQIVPYDPAEPVTADVQVIDGAGGTLIPGLHDMHSHMTTRSGLFYMAVGVTSVRDQGNRPEWMFDMAPKMDGGVVAGPRIVPNLFIDGAGPTASHAGLVAASLDEALKDIRWGAKRGYFQLKIYNSIHPDWVRPMADEAHRLGMGVTGHVPAFVSPDDAIRWGYDDIAHVNQLILGWVLKPGEDTRTTLRLTGLERFAEFDLNAPQVAATIRLMQEHHVALDTTAIIVERLMLSRSRQVQPGDVEYLDHMPVAYQRYRRRTFVPLTAPDDDARYRKAFTTILAAIKLLHDSGIQLLPGTDDPTGFSVQREIELYTLAGLSNAEALRLGTLAADQYLKRSELYGSIARGKASDFFLVPGDPLKDISAIRSVEMVMKGDALYYPSEIYPYLGIAPFAAAPKTLPPTATH